MRLIVLLIFNLFALSVVACELSDDKGVRIYLKKPAKRIISLAPDLTETLFAIGAGNEVVGVISGSDYPALAQKRIKIGSYLGIDLERIVSLQPDLVLTWGDTFSHQLEPLKKMGIPVYTSTPRQLEDVAKTIKNLGCLTGHEATAFKVSDHYLKRLAALGNQFASEKTIPVFYQIGSGTLFTINKTSWINQAIVLCGGRNVFENAKSIAPEVSWESILMAQPEVIIGSAANDAWKKDWAAWPEIPAVKYGKLVTLKPDLLERPGPRLVEGVESLCYALKSASYTHQ